HLVARAAAPAARRPIACCPADKPAIQLRGIGKSQVARRGTHEPGHMRRYPYFVAQKDLAKLLADQLTGPRLVVLQADPRRPRRLVKITHRVPVLSWRCVSRAVVVAPHSGHHRLLTRKDSSPAR